MLTEGSLLVLVRTAACLLPYASVRTYDGTLVDTYNSFA